MFSAPFMVRTQTRVVAILGSLFKMHFQNFALVALIAFCIFHIKLLDCLGLDFTNVKCSSLDKTFSDFDYCYLKSENRTYKHLSLRAILYQKPVTQFKANIALYKRSNGLSPMSYNLTVDGCKVIGHRSPWVNFLFSLFTEHSNINHSCPFNHDIIVEKLPAHFLLQKFTSFLPFPQGDYVFSSNWIVHGINRAHVRVHVSYT